MQYEQNNKTTSVGSYLTNLSLGWYYVTSHAVSATTSTDISEIVSPLTEICQIGSNIGTWFSVFLKLTLLHYQFRIFLLLCNGKSYYLLSISRFHA